MAAPLDPAGLLLALARPRTAAAAVLATFLAVRGIRKGSLSADGACAAALVGFLTLACGWRFGAVLILFYQSGTAVTKAGAAAKAKLDAQNDKVGEARDAAQVLACSLTGVALAVLHLRSFGADDAAASFGAAPARARLLCAYVGHYACCCGDTWASELGQLATVPPRLVTAPWRSVPPGTNGGVSLLGTMASASGGFFIGVAFALLGKLLPAPAGAGPAADEMLLFAFVGLSSGVIGSFLDSLLGATLQLTLYDDDRKTVVPAWTTGPGLRRIAGADVLTNTQVNFVSSLATAWVAQELGAVLAPLLVRA